MRLFIFVTWPVALGIMAFVLAVRLTVAMMHLTWRLTILLCALIVVLCKLLGEFAVWSYGKFVNR